MSGSGLGPDIHLLVDSSTSYLPTPSHSPDIEKSMSIVEIDELADDDIARQDVVEPQPPQYPLFENPVASAASKLNFNRTPSTPRPSQAHLHSINKSPETNLRSENDAASAAKHSHPRRPPTIALSDATNKLPRKLSPEQITELTAVPLSPLLTASLSPDTIPLTAPVIHSVADQLHAQQHLCHESIEDAGPRAMLNGFPTKGAPEKRRPLKEIQDPITADHLHHKINERRPLPNRTASTPPLIGRKKSYSKHDRPLQSRIRRHSPKPLEISGAKQSSANPSALKSASTIDNASSQLPFSTPLPPLSIPTYLQLELDAERDANATSMPFESSAVKFERLRDFLILPAPLEHLLWFGTFACIDAWLYTFTILPLRFCKALWILIRWWIGNAWKDVHDLVEFVYTGLGRLWQRSRNARPSSASFAGENPGLRKRSLSNDAARPPESPGIIRAWPDPPKKQELKSKHKHKRTRSTPSLLLPSHKADLLRGLLVIASSIILLQVDPSRMYHNIRGQAAIKLYVIYNGLEIGDRLLSALGQDVLECLFSREVLDRDPDGRSRIIRPAWMFVIALLYNVVHTGALLYQVITLNVAVNSYSNALLTLLLSNQFVEIKAAVFKKVEKDNLFQLTCADVVERFQLWLMLLIIAMRNMVEIGGINISISNTFDSSTTTNAGANATSLPLSSRILPASFTMIPKFTGQILGPFVIVLGSEMIVDWCKHAYVNKFNDTKPSIYSRFLDVLAKDYYTHAFGDQNLMKRIGLPVLPLACLFIRAAIQTYHMFLATHMPLPLPSTATSLSVESASASSTPATKAALAHVDELFRRALGRSSFEGTAPSGFSTYFLDDAIAFFLLILVVIVVFLLLLAAKLVLGMVMLQWARSRFKGMKERERNRVEVGGTRLGVSAMVEVDDEKRRYIYQDDPEGLARYYEKQDRIKREKERERDKGLDLDKVRRYDMVAKRIW